MSLELHATALLARPSLGYVSELFALQEARELVVSVADEAAASHLPGIRVARCISPADRHGWTRAQHDLIRDDVPGQVVFTSGTEGTRKGIVLTYANMADAADRLMSHMGLTAEIREYVGVPPTYSFGLGRFRAISAVGGEAYLPLRGFDLLEFGRMLAAGEVNSLSAVPTLLRVLLANTEVVRAAGAKLRWMEIGSQPLSAGEKRALRTLFPEARIVQHYGLTEASRTTFLAIDDADESRLESVGRPVGRTEVALGPDSRIRIRGPHVARWRVGAEGLQPLLDDEGWLQTNDLGHWRDGDLYFDGRADDLINCGGLKIVPDVLERQLRDSLGPTANLAVARVPDAIRGEGLLVAVKSGTAAPDLVRSSALAALRDNGIDPGQSLHVMEVDSLPTTETGKVRRSVLTQDFIGRATAPRQEQPAAVVAPADLLQLFRQSFPGQAVTEDDTFESLGGDSLTYLRVSMLLEQRLGPLPPRWEKLGISSLRKLDGQTRGKPLWRRLETPTLIRAAAMICIVALHADTFIYSSRWGAAYVLVMIAGYSVVRFQLPEILRSGSTRSLIGTVLRVAVPTVLVVVTMDVLTRDPDIRPMLLISNFIDPHGLRGVYFYFAEFYMQLLLLAALLFSSTVVRRVFRSRPFPSALGLLLAVALLNAAIDAVWDTEYILHRTPHHYAWAFAAGMVVASAALLRQKLLALVAIGAVSSLVAGPTAADVYVTGAAALIFFLPFVPVPAFVKVSVSEIASASMFLYLSHYQVIDIVRRVFGEYRPWIAFFAIIVVGILFARCYDWAERQVSGTAWGSRLARAAYGRRRTVAAESA